MNNEDTIKLYVWSSDTLAEWSNGNIVSFGTSVDDARKRAEAAVIEKYDTEGSYWQKTKNGLLRDLQRKPTVEGDVALFHGSS